MIEGWVTRDANSLLQPMPPMAFSGSAPQDALPTIEIDDSRAFQPIEGFGFSLTGGSAYLLGGLAAADRTDLLQELFGLTDASVGLSCLRLSIGASDLGWRAYSYWDLEPGTADPDLARFNLAACDPEVVPVLQQILRINPAVKIIASPWSAPSWMKSNGSFVAGSLTPDERSRGITRLRGLAEGLRVEAAEAGPSLEDLDRTLSVLEEKLFAALMMTATEDELVTLREQAARELAPYKGKMQAVQIKQVQQQFLQKRLLEARKLPRLSLFYMSHE